MQMRPRRCSGRPRTASLACSPTASACWRASKQHVVSANRARLALIKAQREVEPRGVGCVPVYGYSLGLAALGAGELSDAAEKLQQAWDLAFRQGINNPNVFPIAGDLAEALARAGESDRCTQIVKWLEERSQATGLAYPRAVACRAQGILATEPEEAQRLFAESLAALDKVGPIPFEQARTLLCSGEAMRRNRRPVAAREPLHRGPHTFRESRRATMGGPRKGRTGSLRREGSTRHGLVSQARRAPGAQPPGTAGCQNCGTRPEQCRGGRSLVRVPKDGGGASDQGLPQARDPLANRTCPDPAGQRNRRLTRTSSDAEIRDLPVATWLQFTRR